MHKAPSAPLGSHSPSGTIAARPAASSSAAATAIDPTDIASEVLDNEDFLAALAQLAALNTRANVKGKRESEALTGFLSQLSKIGKRDGIDDMDPGDDFTEIVAKRQLQGIASLAEGLLGPVAKRDGESGGLGDLTSLATGFPGGLAKRDDLEARQNLGGVTSVLTKVLGGLAKRDDLEARQDLGGVTSVLTKVLGGLAKRDFDETLEARQLDLVGTVATSLASNAGAAAGTLGKGAFGMIPAVGKSNKRSGEVLPGMDQLSSGLKSLQPGGSTKNDVDEDVPPQADMMEALREGHDVVNSATEDATEKAHMGKRQVPPISGSSGLSVLMGVLANPKVALAPFTKGFTIAGSNPLDGLTKA
jgi:hypothetical protein